MSNLEPHHSLPARPPHSAHPSQKNGQNQRAYPNTTTPYGAFTPRAVMSHLSTAPMATPPLASYGAGGYAPTYPSTNAYYQHQQSGYGTSTPSMMSNPYSVPGADRAFGRPGYDAEEEARIAEWNSGYAPKEDGNKKGLGVNANAAALGTRFGDGGTPVAGARPGGNGSKGKQKTVVRQGGGKSWEDPSLLEWDPLHPRLFVGNLAGEVTDDSLLKAFAKYPSVSKARVIRDKKSSKSKSYGFVSFANTDDYFRAAKEMEGKYIGSHPVRIKRANTEITATTKRDDKHGKQGKNNKKAGGNATTTLVGSPMYISAGVTKPSHKKHSGPRMLG